MCVSDRGVITMQQCSAISPAGFAPPSSSSARRGAQHERRTTGGEEVIGRCHFGDCRKVLRELIAAGAKAQMCVTSPPYWGLRDYGVAWQMGLEKSPDEYVATMVEVFRLVREMLADDGVLFLNLGDSYFGSGKGGGGSFSSERPGWREVPCGTSGKALADSTIAPLKPKDLVGIPWRVAFALQADGWYLRSDIIWHKSNPMPESVRDRPTRSHEYIFLMSKRERYYYDADAIKEPASNNPNDQIAARKARASMDQKSAPTSEKNGIRPDKQRGHPRRHAGFNDRWDHMPKAEQAECGRNKRDVWTVATRPYSGAHFATFSPALIEPCILAGSKPGDIVLDPFGGSGTTGQVAEALGRKWTLIELKPEYEKLGADRTRQIGMEMQVYKSLNKL